MLRPAYWFWCIVYALYALLLWACLTVLHNSYCMCYILFHILHLGSCCLFSAPVADILCCWLWMLFLCWCSVLLALKQTQNKKWITFTYHSPLIRKVTNLFKDTNIKIAFRANSTVYQQLVQKTNSMNPSGVYEIKCNTCGKNYVGQSGRPITTRHKEHIRYIKTNKPVSAYATHILNNRHEYGTANDTLKLIQPCRKSMKMNHW